ncbi:MAG: BatD family protein, partial [Chitinophagales bacterium]
ISYENHLSTEKIEIRVKPYPASKKPSEFNGATGNFSIGASLEKNELSKNEEGALIVTISGKGNFTQLPAPVVQWPNAIEGFEPIIKDSLEKTQVPLKGSRTFRFPFVGNKPGDYSIPSISLAFFNPDSNKYQTVSSGPVEIKINNEEKKERPTEQKTAVIPEKSDHSAVWLYGSIFFVVLLIILIQLRKPAKEEVVNENDFERPVTSVSTLDLLKPVQFSLIAEDGQFYTLLQKSIWEYLGTQLKLSGSKMNKDELHSAMKQRNMEEQYHSIIEILQECEGAVFTKAEFVNDKQELLNKARAILAKIKA